MIDVKDLPLEVEDHVVLDEDLVFNGNFTIALVVPAGSHGMVKRIKEEMYEVYVEFNGMLFRFSFRWAQRNLSLYRRSQHSHRRDAHDKSRLKPKKVPKKA